MGINIVNGLGHRLKIARIEAGYTQKQVADLLGFDSDSTISTYEKAGSNPNAFVLMKLAGLYRISTDYLLGLNSDDSLRLNDRLNERQRKLMIQLEREILHENEEQAND